FRLSQREAGGSYVQEGGAKSIQWVFQDLNGEHTSFTMFQDDPASDVRIDSRAQIMLSTSSRSVRLADGGLQNVRVSESLMTLQEAENPPLFQILTGITTQMGSLFP
ncbi:MAG TPA: hypothetical protein VGK54_01120, partial [Chloroflexota bacterium]